MEDNVGWQDHVVEAPIREPNAELIEQVKQKVLQELKEGLTIHLTTNSQSRVDSVYLCLNGEEFYRTFI